MGVQKAGNALSSVDQEALSLLQKVCAAIAGRHATDDQDVRECVQASLGSLSEQERDRITETFRRILAFQTPPSRSSQ